MRPIILNPATTATSDLDDAALLARSLDEPAAFDHVFERHHSVVYRYLVSRLGIGAAEDAVAETFLAAFATRGRFDPARGTSAVPWLLGIATKRIARHRRAVRQHFAEAVAAAQSSTATNDTDDRSIARSDAASLAPALAGALQHLSAREREPLLLHVLGDLSYEEVAAALSLPIGTVRSRISRARTRLAGIMDGVAR
ncbi:MAG: RNA polymerase sigma factor [Thermoleophilia bacterium]|nr:RNA polymerase sigma factor [Thermoleophilia bacterium]